MRTLKEIALDLLDKYEASEEIVIDEFSTNIKKADKELRRECERIREEIAETDAVEVVRCKDCKKDETNRCPMYRAHFGYTNQDYCSCGKREEQEHG